MYDQKEKSKVNKSKTFANLRTQTNKRNVLQGFELEDNRPKSIAQRKLHETARNITKVNQTFQLQDGNKNPILEQESIQKKASNTGLPSDLKIGMENLSGISLDDVKVHYNSNKPAQLQAHAYAQGTEIHIASGKENHLPHEAWHVVQQKQGRVKPTLQMKGGVNVNDDIGLEHEADVMGNKAMQFKKNTNHKPVTIKYSSVTKPISQLYSTVGKGNIWGYGKGAGAHAPNFEFQEVSASKIVNDVTSTINYGVNANQVFEDSPLLRVSDDRTLAVPTRNKSNAKSFYSTAGKIAESNVRLHNAGAPLRLDQGAGQIRLSDGLNPFGPTLNQVTPNLTNVINDNSECGAFAQNILGTPVHNAETIDALGVVNEIPGLGTGPGRDLTINTALGGHDPEALGANSKSNPEVGESFGIYARHNVPPVGIATSLWNGIISVKDYISKTKPHLQWGEHWAGVVAKSGSDLVTLENYNRVASGTALIEEAVENDFNELKGMGSIEMYVQNTKEYSALLGESRLERIARLGRNYMKYAFQIGVVDVFLRDQFNHWYFQMYGSGKQSFHEQFKDSVPDAVTFKTHGTDVQLQNLLVPNLTALLPADNYQAGANPVLVNEIGLVNAAVGRTNIIAAFIAGEKAICLARLHSAYVYEQTQGHDPAQLSIAYSKAVAVVTGSVGDAVNAQCVAGIDAMQAS